MPLDSGAVEHVLRSDESHFTIWQSDVQICVWQMPGRTPPTGMHSPDNKFGRGGIMVRGCFSGFGLGPLAPVKGNVNASAYEDVMNIIISLFLFQHHCAPVQAKSIKTWSSQGLIRAS